MHDSKAQTFVIAFGMRLEMTLLKCIPYFYRRDPIQNAKVDATSTVFGVVQIGLRGGIFQYTNAMKLLGKRVFFSFFRLFELHLRVLCERNFNFNFRKSKIKTPRGANLIQQIPPITISMDGVCTRNVAKIDFKLLLLNRKLEIIFQE